MSFCPFWIVSLLKNKYLNGLEENQCWVHRGFPHIHFWFIIVHYLVQDHEYTNRIFKIDCNLILASLEFHTININSKHIYSVAGDTEKYFEIKLFSQ